MAALGVAHKPTTTERVIAFLIRWAMLSAAVWLAAAVIGGIHADGWGSIIFVGLVLGLANALLKPALFWITLPLTVLTLGLFLLVLNTGLFALAAWIAGQVDGVSFEVDGFWAAFFGALIVSVVGWVLGFLIDPEKRARKMAG
jgi:putative membrane protein